MTRGLMQRMILSAAALMTSTCAFANGVADTVWLLAPSGGTYSWDGDYTHGLVGTNIGVGAGIALNNLGPLGIAFGSLNFTSGAYNGNGSNWSWGAGGTFEVTGCIAGVTAVGPCDGTNNVTLFSDDFTGISIVPVVQPGRSGFALVSADLAGILNADFAAHFGLAPSANAFSLNVVQINGLPGQALSGTNVSGRITATSSVAVAEDAGLAGGLALYAIAAAVFGLAWRLARRQTRSALRSSK